MQIKRKNVVFASLILPYLYILLVLVAVWIASSVYVTHSSKEKLLSLFENNVKGHASVVDATLQQIETEVLNISENEVFRDFCKAEQLTHAEKMKYLGIFSSNYTFSDVVDIFYLYSYASGIVLDQGSTYNSLEDFYRYGCTIEGISKEEWVQMVRSGAWASGYTRQRVKPQMYYLGGNVLSFASMIPLENPQRAYGVVGTLINEKSLLDVFSNLIDPGDGAVYVFNAQNEVMLSSNSTFDHESSISVQSNEKIKKFRMGGKEYYSFKCSSQYRHWQYVVFVSSDYVLRDIAFVNIIVHTINIIAILIGLLLCIRLASKKTTSHLQMMDLLGVQADAPVKQLGFNEIEYWKPYVNDIIDEKETMKDKLMHFREHERKDILHILIAENHENEKEVLKLIQDAQIEFLCQKFMILVLRGQAIYHIDALHNRNSFYKQVIDKYIAEGVYIHMYAADSKTTVVLLNYDMDTVEMQLHLKEQLIKMNLEVFYRYHSKVVIGLGEETQLLSEISSSYLQALEVVRYNELMGSGSVMYYSELSQEQALYDYSVEFENRFIRSILNGNIESVQQMIDEIYENNFERRKLTVKRIEELFGEISSSLNKVKQASSQDEEIIPYSIKDFTVSSFFDYVRDFAYSMCEEAKQTRELNDMNKFGDVIRYVNEHYDDSNLSLISLAEKFGFKGVSYISRGFKYFINENFSSYLEKIRIEKAGELLLNGMKIKEVYQKVGYISDVSFRRAFKKRVGLSPTEFVRQSGKA